MNGLQGLTKEVLRQRINSSFIFSQKRFYLFLQLEKMVVIAQLVRASDCGSEGRRFEPG